jgi:hypothetical protein
MRTAATAAGPRSDVKIAVAAWALLAVGIAGVTLGKRDVVALQAPAAGEATAAAGSAGGGGTEPKLVGKVVRRDAAGVTVRVKEGGRTVERTVPAAEVRSVSPLGERSVTGVYRWGVERWWAREGLYTEGPHGFLYLPQAALVFAPFAALPPSVGEVLWRWAGIAACAWGLWRVCTLVFRERSGEAFLPATLLCLPALLGSAQNGQTNLAMAGLFVLAAADGATDRRWRCTLWLMLALACKPVALPVVLLLGAVRPRIIPQLLIGLACFAAAPFLHPDPAYVWSQYAQAPRKILTAGGQEEYIFSDVRGMLMDFGLAPDAWTIPLGAVKLEVLTVVRALAAGVTLGLALLTSWTRRGKPGAEPTRSWLAVALGVAYILLFNPRTEGVTYAMMGPVVGVLGARALVARRWGAAALLIAYALVLQFSMQVTGPAQALAERLGLLAPDAYEHKYWLRPLLTVGVYGHLARLAGGGRALWPVAAVGQSSKRKAQSSNRCR